MTVFHLRKPLSTPSNPRSYCGRKPESQEKTNYPLMAEYSWVKHFTPSSICINCLQVIQGQERRQQQQQEEEDVTIPF